MGASKLLKPSGEPKEKPLGAIIPQILPGYLASSLYCFEGNEIRFYSWLGECWWYRYYFK